MLHLDANSYYGAGEATLDLPAFIALLLKGSSPDTAVPSAPATPGRNSLVRHYSAGSPTELTLLQLHREVSGIMQAVDDSSQQLPQSSYTLSDATLQTTSGYSIDLWPQVTTYDLHLSITCDSRDWTLDLVHHLQVAYCCDPIIETLLHCQAQHYIEFKLLQARCCPYVSTMSILIRIEH